MSATETARKMTGPAASDAERRAATWLSERLRERNREVEIEPVSVRISDAGTISIHCALAVVGGLIDRPVIAVPTSIGYGAHFGGLAALLAMLNSCAAGVTVVNIDNGFGAGVAAALINRA